MLRVSPVLMLLFLIVFATSVSAHAASEQVQSASVIRLLESILIIGAVFAYACGVVRIRRDVGPDRVVSRSQTSAFALAIALFVVILSPQVDHVTDALFSAHMAQHLVLMLIIPPLLVWSRPLLVTIWGLPRSWRRDFAASAVVHRLRSVVWFLMHPLSVATLFLGTFSFWHLPRPYAWSLENEWIHTFEHLSFVISAFMFWTLVIEPSGRRRMEFIPTMLFVAAIAVLSGLPGALMILSPVTLFKAHGNAALDWGLSPLEDQQIAGLIMWVPAGIFFLVPIALLFVKSLQLAERRHAVARTMMLLAVSLMPIVVSSHAKAETGDALADGKALINKYGCGTCHAIPGIDNATGRVGPPLGGLADRIFIAGRLQNNLDNMMKWISDPQSVAPGNAMPNMGIKPADARAIAAYLSTLHEDK